MLIFNVACADFIMATFGIVMPLVSSVYRRWFFGDLGCDIYAFTMNIVGMMLYFIHIFLHNKRCFV